MGAEELRGADVITRLVDVALESVGGERARLFLSDDDGLQLHSARNARKEALRREDVDAAGVAKRVVRKRGSFCDVQVRTSSLRESLTRLDSFGAGLFEISVMAAPLRRGDRILGVLYVDAKAEHRRFTAADLRVVEAAADRLAAALDVNAQGP